MNEDLFHYVKEELNKNWVLKEVEKSLLWKDTYFEPYHLMANSNKGKVFERSLSALFKAAGMKVKAREKAGHDWIVNDVPSEIKGSIRLVSLFIFNHISLAKNWEICYFAAINALTNETYLYSITKEEFRNNLSTTKPIFKPQQGGKDGGNDDYMLIATPDTFLNNPCFIPLARKGILHEQTTREASQEVAH